MQDSRSTIHEPPERSASPRKSGSGDIWAIGFGVTVSMWTVGYVGRMPLTDVAPVVFIAMMLACLVAGGWVVGRYTRRGLAGGVWVGLLATTLNLLILGSLLKVGTGEETSVAPRRTVPFSSNENRDSPPPIPSPVVIGPLVPQAWLWVPGTFALCVALTTLGTLLALALARARARPARPADADVPWNAILAWITASAALLLIVAGGLVTGFRAGLAVPDWPNTYGSNMFLFPLTLMTGGIFYEHAHRLLGSLVGLATLVLAIRMTASAQGRLRPVAAIWLIGVAAALQGILGGFRVTDDSHILAVIHGFFAHAVLGGIVGVAVVLSARWTAPRGVERRESAGADRFLTAMAVVLVLLQTFLGTLVRQLNVLLLTHITVAAIVVVGVLGAGMRAWGLNPHLALLRRCGLWLMAILLLQVVLGLTAIPFRTPAVDQSPTAAMLEARDQQLPVAPLNAVVTTAHQSCAAVLLCTALILALWTWHLLKPLEFAEHDRPDQQHD